MMTVCHLTVNGLIEGGVKARGEDIPYPVIWEHIFYQLDGHLSAQHGFAAGVAASAVITLIDREVNG